MLADLLRKGYAEGKDLNCAEEILYGANQVYKLGLDKEALKLAAGFGGGMAIEDKCGVLTGAIMVLGKIFVEDKAHESNQIKVLTRKLIDRYRIEMGNIDCKPLKTEYRTEQYGCQQLIVKAAELLDEIIAEERN